MSPIWMEWSYPAMGQMLAVIAGGVMWLTWLLTGSRA